MSAGAQTPPPSPAGPALPVLPAVRLEVVDPADKEAIAWLWVRSYISDSVMEKLELAPEVRSARARFTRQLAS